MYKLINLGIVKNLKNTKAIKACHKTQKNFFDFRISKSKL